MKIATWNVNSLKVRLPHVLDWLAASDVDVLCLQETKMTDENFPASEIREAGYHVVFSGRVRILDLYVVNGQEVGSEKYAHKLHWLEKVTDYMSEQLETHDKFVTLGDFNIAPDDRDVHAPEEWVERILCSTPERDALKKILNLGLTIDKEPRALERPSDHTPVVAEFLLD